MGTWLREAGADLSVCRAWDGDEVPSLSAYDGWVVLGGSMNAYADEVAPWLPTVRDRIAEAARDGVPVLGICLGHQLAAVATGGAVTVNLAGQRVGLYDIGWTAAAGDDALVGPLASPRRGVQWNSDIVTSLGESATVLATLPDGEIQAARFAPTVWGVQWHPEVDRAIATSWAEGDRQDHLERGIDQDVILEMIEGAGPELQAAWRPLAESFVAQVGRAARAARAAEERRHN